MLKVRQNFSEKVMYINIESRSITGTDKAIQVILQLLVKNHAVQFHRPQWYKISSKYFTVCSGKKFIG